MHSLSLCDICKLATLTYAPYSDWCSAFRQRLQKDSPFKVSLMSAHFVKIAAFKTVGWFCQAVWYHAILPDLLSNFFFKLKYEPHKMCLFRLFHQDQVNCTKWFHRQHAIFPLLPTWLHSTGKLSPMAFPQKLHFLLFSVFDLISLWALRVH